MILLVTGARSGFGKLAVIEAAQRGHTVYASLRDLDTAGPLREAAAGLDVIPVQLDVTRSEERQAVVAQIMENHGRIDGLVNNAGVALGGFLEEIDEDELRKQFEVNVFGLWALTRLVLPTMRDQRSGTIVNLSSVSGRMALPGLGAYAASKHAVEGMSESWRAELAPWGIRVVLIEPGPFKTDIFERNRWITRNSDNADSPYAPMTRRLWALFEDTAKGQAEDPAVVVERICDVLEAKHPTLRHPLGKSARLRLAARWALPGTAWEKIVRRVVGFDGLV